MKKISLFILLFVAAFCYGNDIIITKQSEKLEVTIVEVSKNEIKYRKASNPTGPVFVLDKADISSIIYSNGEVEAFATPTTSNETAYPAITGNNNANNSANEGSPIVRLGSNLYSKDGKMMNSKEFGYFLQNNCQEAYAQWRKGTAFQNYGITWITLGPVLCLPVGLTLYACSFDGRYVDAGMYYSGIFFMTFGSAMTVASIPFLAIGVRERNNAYLTYNNTCAKSAPKMSLNFQVKTDGLGLALNF